MTAYVIIDINVHDPVRYEEYKKLAAPTVELYGGKYIARGGVVLACNLALHDVVETIRAKENVSPEAARKQALALLVPGVIVQPSGVFAALHAQDAAGCKYLRAS